MKQTNYDCCGMRFIKETITDLKTGKPLTIFMEDDGTLDAFQIRINSSGLTFKGEMSGFIYSEDDMQEFAQFLSVCFVELRRLRPRISTSFTDG